ncbi:hypothetical protein MHYP_G00325560 [Metynnis hypsauchen]
MSRAPLTFASHQPDDDDEDKSNENVEKVRARVRRRRGRFHLAAEIMFPLLLDFFFTGVRSEPTLTAPRPSPKHETRVLALVRAWCARIRSSRGCASVACSRPGRVE